MRLLSICTSFRRPSMLPEMLKTFEATRGKDTGMVIRLHDDDPHIDRYKCLLGSGLPSGVQIEIGHHICMQEALNHYTEKYPEIPYRQIITDDARYETKDWDSILIDKFEKNSKGWGFICGDDRLNDSWFSWSHPSMEIWSYKMFKLVGFAYPRSVKHRGLDTYTKELCAGIGICPFVPEVIIRHLQGAGCSNPDENLAWVNSRDAEKEALDGLGLWRKKEKTDQINKIKTAMAAGL